MANKYKTANGIRFTKSLFLEMSYEDKTNVIYSLKDEDGDYPSLYKLYIQMGDLTELRFARTYFDGWEHWQMIAQSNWMKPYLSRWREELELEVKALALTNILEISKDSTHKANYEASKFILSGGWKAENKDKVGRPSKEAIRQKAEELFTSEKQHKDDYLRIIDNAGIR